MKKVSIGIDVGKLGAIAIQHEGGRIECHKMPLIGKVWDTHAMKDILKPFRAGNGIYEAMVVIEDVHAIFNSSANTTFQFGQGAGLLEGILAAYEIPFVKINPKKWQELCFQGVPEIHQLTTKVKDNVKEGKKKIDTKAMALVAMKRIYPNQPLNFGGRAEKPHEGLVDAVLISHYCKLKL